MHFTSAHQRSPLPTCSFLQVAAPATARAQRPLHPPCIIIQEAERCDMGALHDLVAALAEVGGAWQPVNQYDMIL